MSSGARLGKWQFALKSLFWHNTVLSSSPLSLSLSHTHTLSLSLSHTHTHTLSLSHTQSPLYPGSVILSSPTHPPRKTKQVLVQAPRLPQTKLQRKRSTLCCSPFTSRGPHNTSDQTKRTCSILFRSPVIGTGPQNTSDQTMKKREEKQKQKRPPSF